MARPIEGTEKVTPMIIDECTKAPQASFRQKLKAEWKKVVTASRLGPCAFAFGTPSAGYTCGCFGRISA